MRVNSQPTPEILAGSGPIENMQGVTILEDWRQYDTPQEWVLKLRLAVKSENIELVPSVTDWYVKVKSVYPSGDIEFDPAKESSIVATFQHQFHNSLGFPRVPWRNGRICAKDALFNLRKRCYVDEPFDAEKRLQWNVAQARGWLLKASKGTLVDVGDPFELPDYKTELSQYVIAFSESPRSAIAWDGRRGEHGIAVLGQLPEPKDTFLVLRFNDRHNKPILDIPWNIGLRNSVIRLLAAPWVLLRDILVLPPWEAPMSWRALRQFARAHGIDWNRLLTNLTWPLTWDSLQFMLLGFQIPEKIGERGCQVHWQALRFPGVSREPESTRSTEDKPVCLPNSRGVGPCGDSSDVLRWQASQNWHVTQTFNRGMFPDDFRSSRIFVVGAGALGSMISEILVRGGIMNVILADADRVEIGNLARHTLSVRDIRRTKVEALATRLRGISPHIVVQPIPRNLENFFSQDMTLVSTCDIVLDTTGSDDVLDLLERFPWSKSPVFCSVSVGLQARRLYVFMSRRKRFPASFFLRHVNKWLLRDESDYDGGPLPVSGGIGCWHSAFPARADDMWLLAATAIKYIENQFRSGKRSSILAVFEQRWEHGGHCGVSLVREEEDND